MGELGILHEDERVELVEGEIVEMSPIGPAHGSVVARINSVLLPPLVGRAILWPQNALVLPRQTSMFQRDVALIRPRDDFYRTANPEPRDVLLLIEVMDSPVYYDRRVKLPIYARAGLGEIWLANVTNNTVEVCRRPVGGEYRDRRVAARSDTISPLAFPDLALPVQALLG